MKTKTGSLAKVLFLLTVVLCIVGLASCNVSTTCTHEWSEWTTTANPTCSEEGTQERHCEKCQQKETAAIDTLAHDWSDATCAAPKTCKNCSATEGAALAHTDADNNHVCDVCEGTASECTDADTDTDHACDACGAVIGECADSDTDTDHACDTCGEVIGECADSDTDTDHACDVCGKVIGECADSDTDTDHACDVCGSKLNECSDVEGDGNHTCDVCGAAEASAHNFGDATCGTPATCSECGATTGTVAEHIYNQEVVKTEALKSAATCTSAAVYYKSCSCGAISTKAVDVFESGSALPHSHTLETVKDGALKFAATCTSAAVYYKSCACGAISTSDAETFTSGSVAEHTYDQTIATAETAKTEATCTEAATYYKSCTCGAISTKEADVFSSGSAKGHSHSVTATTEATCTAAATKTYSCTCGDSYVETVGDALDHSIAGATATEKHLGGCEYVLVYKCVREGCGVDIEKDHIFRHTHVATITKAATCQADGVKTLTCACGDTTTEAIPKDATGHSWSKGTVTDGVRVDTCEHCGTTKNVTVYEGTKTDATNANDLKDTEIELNNANISLDNGVIDALGNKDVTLSADKLEGGDREHLGLSAEELAQVGDSPIYNFTMSDGSGNISQFGEDNWVTITLPYTLAEGEDVDSIAIWFINDEGELESIKATYNNGYVTFKTNHFSYYTVTRLTPAERCALYDHSYTVQHQEGSCTQDGYDLYFCVRCHESHKEKEVIADGHDYTEQTTAATCTEDGKTVYSCDDCGHSYQIKIPATGHAWTVKESVEATCAQNGHTDYVCSNCSGTYSVAHAKVPHEYERTVVAPTCESDGYTLYDCKNCDHTYSDSFVAAIGHSYKATGWTWATDYSSATLSFACENDATHVTVINANVGTTVINGTCSNFVKTVYTAAVTFEGVVYTDEKSVETGTPEHSFSTEWKTDGEKHWHECVCGEKSDIASHAYANATVTKQPTCAEDGESTATCVCGKTEISAVPATGEHTYENGSCTVCGKPSCDHTTLHRESVDFEELGGCAWILYYDTCDCGEVKILDEDLSDISCDFDYEESEEEEGEDGTVHMTASGSCPDCGIHFFVEAYARQSGCTEIYSYRYVFYIEDEVVIEVTMEDSYTYHESTTREDIDLAEEGCCGGTLTVSKCSECGEIINLYGADPDCDVDLESEPETEEIIDANGVVHYVQKVECSECGFTVKMESWEEVISACEKTTYMSASIFCGDKIFLEICNEDHEEEHEYEYEYELKGDSCEDGVTVHAYCPKCEDTLIGKTSSHVEREYNVTIDLSEFTDCGGTVNADRCKVCGIYTNVNDTRFNCNYGDNYTDVIERDDEGNIIFRESTATCRDCGLTFIDKEWIEYTTDCEYIEWYCKYIRRGEEILLSCERKSYGAQHDYEYEYELRGETCEDGINYVATCTVCGDSYQGGMSGHASEEFVFDVTEIGGCGGAIEGRRCVICGEITGIYNMDIECNVENGTQEEFVDDNGVAHMVFNATCPDCGLRYVGDDWAIRLSECEIRRGSSLAIYKDGECVFDEVLQEYTNANHQFEYRYELRGETCEDGYNVFAYCHVCGKSENYGYSAGHRYDWYEFDLSEYGCGGVISGQWCPVCETILTMGNMYFECNFDDKNAVEEEYEDENGILHTKVTMTCLECGLKVMADGWVEAESVCVSTEYMTVTVYANDEVVFEGTSHYRYENHQYEYQFETDGSDCENYKDGYYISYHCSACGESDKYENYGHYYEHEKVDLSELGLCGGEAEKEYCLACGKIGDAYVNEWCEWESRGEFVDGYEKVVCRQCGAEKLYYQTISEKDENCREYCTSITIYLVNGEEVYRIEDTYYNIMHDFEREITMHGVTCEDGYTVKSTCRDCGYSFTEDNRYHNNYNLYNSNESAEGCCSEHTGIEIHGCACGRELYVKFNEYSFAYDEATQTYYCPNCPMTIVNATVEEINGCVASIVRVITVKVGDTVLYSYERSGLYQHHTFNNASISEVDGKKTYTTTCETCGKKNEVETMTAVLEEHEKEFYYDFTFTPEESGIYVIMGLGKNDTYATLYQVINNKLTEMQSDDDSAGSGQFRISATLEAGNTYVYRIRYYNAYMQGEIEFSFGGSSSNNEESASCRHNDVQIYSLPEGASSCHDGVLCIHLCSYCGIINGMYTEYEHYSQMLSHVDLEKAGACYGNFYFYSCACGENHGIEFYSCARKGTHNEQYDDQGRLLITEVKSCSDCGLRYDSSYYVVESEDSCVKTYHYTVSITMGGKLLFAKEFTVSQTEHDYQYANAHLNGDSCYDGGSVTFKCVDCGAEKTQEIYSHEMFVREKIDLAALGNVCGGYATVYGCACGESCRLELDHTLCDWDINYADVWIEDALKGYQQTINGEYGPDYTAYIYTCAVTDPAELACGHKIRMARYWLKDENSCYAIYYETWQFGYNPEDGSFAYEITLQMGNPAVWHNYETTTDDNGNTSDVCPDCGSSCHVNYEYDANGGISKEQVEINHTLDDDYPRKHVRIYEYAIGADGTYYRCREYYYHMRADGSEVWEDTRNILRSFPCPFGDYGYEVIKSYSNSWGESWEDSYAYVVYKNHEFSIYTYHQENEFWERTDYSYSFEGECIRTVTYSNSYGEKDSTWTENCCIYYDGETTKEPTCTQDGEYCRQCAICGTKSDVEVWEPKGHSWVWISDNHYYCFACGLENANGASGDVVLEDLTDKYGNGESYVVGYYTYSGVEFTYYVSLILPTGEEIILPGDVEIVKLEEIRGFAFSKAAVEAFAATNGITEYDVRFAFVPYGADGSFDYAITFAEATVPTGAIAGSVSFKELSNGDGSAKIYTVTPTSDGFWNFIAIADFYVYAEIYDANGNLIATSWDDYHTYRMNFDLQKGQTYTIFVYGHGKGNLGVILNFQSYDQEKGEDKPVYPEEEGKQ